MEGVDIVVPCIPHKTASDNDRNTVRKLCALKLTDFSGVSFIIEQAVIHGTVPRPENCKNLIVHLDKVGRGGRIFTIRIIGKLITCDHARSFIHKAHIDIACGVVQCPIIQILSGIGSQIARSRNLKSADACTGQIWVVGTYRKAYNTRCRTLVAVAWREESRCCIRFVFCQYNRTRKRITVVECDKLSIIYMNELVEGMRNISVTAV